MENKVTSGILLILLTISLSTVVFDTSSVSASLPVHNIDTGEDFATIQEAIDDPDTVNRHTILVDLGTYHEHLIIYKSISLIGEKMNETTIDAEGIGTVLRITTSNVTVKGFTIRNGGTASMHGNGIYIDHSSGSNLTHNILTNNEYAMKLNGSSNIRISNCILHNNFRHGALIHESRNISFIDNHIHLNQFQGIRFEYSSNSTIAGNHIYQNGAHGLGIGLSSGINILDNSIYANDYHGIEFDSSSNNFICSNNIFRNDDFGIELELSSHNLIANNSLEDNRYGIYILFSTENNSIYHNKFVNNADQVHVWLGEECTWDNGYPSGGNYWSDYNGVDEYSGENQDLPGSDGIGDTPHIIDEHNQDNYPLISPFDIAIENTTISKTIVGTGYPLTINVTSRNVGLYTETFNINAYANSTLLGTEEITLANKSSTSTLFTWDTTGFAKGNYTISAYAIPIPGEIRTVDNSCTDGTVLVTIAGDVNGDRVVDIFDLSIVGQAYGSFSGDPEYNPYADITEDGLVDAIDLAVVTFHYGETDP